jgi:hypothetical protein
MNSFGPVVEVVVESLSASQLKDAVGSWGSKAQKARLASDHPHNLTRVLDTDERLRNPHAPHSALAWNSSREGNWDGHLRADGRLSFQTPVKMKKALKAFHDQAYIEFFGRDDWAVDGAEASIALDAALPVDCVSYEAAFVAAAALASAGHVDVTGIGGTPVRIWSGGLFVERLGWEWKQEGPRGSPRLVPVRA